MEPFLIKRFGQEVYFATAMGSVFNFNDKVYLDFFQQFLKSNKINEINIVVETSCRFLNSILNKEGKINCAVEEVIQSLFLHNAREIEQEVTLQAKQTYLAKLLIKDQIKELEKIELFSTLAQQKALSLKGLVTSISDKRINEVKIHND